MSTIARAGRSHWTLRREACLRPEYASLYPGVPSGTWEVAAVLVDRIVASRLLRGGNLAMPGRILSADHFDFRGGIEDEDRPRREDR